MKYQFPLPVPSDSEAKSFDRFPHHALRTAVDTPLLHVWQHPRTPHPVPRARPQIHTGKMEANSFLGADVDLGDLAMRTKNFSGAEIEGLVKSATSFALNRQVDVSDLSKPINEENLKARTQP